MTTCSRCHESQPEGTKFCMSCGARFAYESRPIPAAAPVAPEVAFAPTVATELPTKPGAGSPSSIPPAAAVVRVSATPAPSPRVVSMPPSAGTTPPPFSTPKGLVVTPPRAMSEAPAEDHSIVVATVLGKLVGLDAGSGAVVWEHGIEAGTPQLVIAHGLVLAAVGQSLYCCEYRTGRPMWRAPLSVYAQRVTMVIDGDRIYAFGAGAVDAFDRGGRRLWTRMIADGAIASGAIGVPGNVSQADRD